ncbi:MAG: hypothetical protein L0I62_10020 [Gammaproteobacteria bacterium]|nr:hypothetical protein [Gammaproteobacteria bacterium]
MRKAFADPAREPPAGGVDVDDFKRRVQARSREVKARLEKGREERGRGGGGRDREM